MKMLNRLIGAIYCASYIIILTILFLSKQIEYARICNKKENATSEIWNMLFWE